MRRKDRKVIGLAFRGGRARPVYLVLGPARRERKDSMKNSASAGKDFDPLHRRGKRRDR